ncbi:MAG: hypothetical protein ACFCUQ_08550 [Kiloniellales bacterium]
MAAVEQGAAKPGTAKRAGAAKPKLQPRAGMNASAKLIIGVLGLPLVGVLFPTCLVLGAGMLPTALAFLFDRGREKYLVLTIAMTNFCGILPAVTELWARGQSLGSAAATLADPLHWVMAYGAATVGWLLHMGMPPIISVYYEQLTRTRVRQLAQQQKRLVDTWGEDVKLEAKSEAAAEEKLKRKSGPTLEPRSELDASEVLGL